jgi:hypothetical protein
MTKIPEFGPSGGGSESLEGNFLYIERDLVTYISPKISLLHNISFCLVFNLYIECYIYELSCIYMRKEKGSKQSVKQVIGDYPTIFLDAHYIGPKFYPTIINSEFVIA